MTDKTKKILKIIERAFVCLACLLIFISLQYRNVPGTLKQKMIISILFDFSFAVTYIMSYIRTRRKSYIFEILFFLFLMILNISTLFKRNLI